MSQKLITGTSKALGTCLVYTGIHCIGMEQIVNITQLTILDYEPFSRLTMMNVNIV